MLDLDRPLAAGGLGLFADHQAHDVFHWLPGPPRLTPTREALSLVVFREAGGGGFLTLQVDLRVDDARLAAAREALEERTRAPVTLVPVLMRSGRARLVAAGLGGSGAGDAPAVAASVLGHAAPALAGDLRALFSLRLTPDGVGIVRASLEDGGASLLAAAYELSFEGLMRAREARIEIDYHRAYEVLLARAAVGSLWVQADAAAAFERLLTEGHVRIEDTSAAPRTAEELAARDRELRELARELATGLFWQPEPVAAASARTDARVTQVGLRLRAARQEESQTLVYDRRETGVVTRLLAPQGPLALPAGVALADVTREVREDAFFEEPRRFTVFTGGADVWRGAAAAVVDVRQGARVASLDVSPEAPEASALLPPAPREVRVRVLAAEDPDLLRAAPPGPIAPADPEAPADPPEAEGGAEATADAPHPWRPFDGWLLALHPARELGRRDLDVALVGVDPDVVPDAEVTVSLGEARRTLRLDAGHPAERLAVAGEGPVTVQALLRVQPPGGAGQDVAIARDVPPGETLVPLAPPAGLLRSVTAALVDPTARYEALTVEVERADGTGRRALRLDAARPSATWSWVPGEARLGYRWRATAMLRDGTLHEGAWHDGADALLLVGDAHVALQRLQVLLLGAGDHLGGVLTVRADPPPEGVDGTVEVLLDPGRARADVLLPVPANAPATWDAEATVFDPDGSERRFVAHRSDAEVVVLS